MFINVFFNNNSILMVLFVSLQNIMVLLYTWQMLLPCCLYTFLSASLFSRDERLWAHHRRPGHHHLHPRHPRGIRLRQVHLRCHRTLLDQDHEQKPCLMMISAFSNSSKCLSMFSIIIILFLWFCLFYCIT